MEFALPLGLWGLLSVPALLAVYFLIGRAKPMVVSSLFLWTHQKRLPKSGMRWHRLQTPLTFLIEVLLLVLLTLAAAGPRVPKASGTAPLVVVLDDSFSMAAGNEDSPRTRAIRDLRNLLQKGNFAPVRVVLAGPDPKVLQGSEFGEPQISLWRCNQPLSDMAAAIGLARELAGARTPILAVSDRAPEFAIETGQLQWRAYGEPIPNLAFVDAGRSGNSGEDRCMLEVGNYSNRGQTAIIKIEGAGEQGLRLELAPGERQRLRFRAPNRDRPVFVQLPDDALALDNRVWLAPQRQVPTRVKLLLSEARLEEAVGQALNAAGEWERVEENPDLVILDGNPAQIHGIRPDTWMLRFPSADRGRPLLGPFVVDTGHPLSDGLALNGVIWNADRNWEPQGLALISAGNLALLSETDLGRSRIFHLNYVIAGGGLHLSPNWPVFFWNLLRLRAEAMPGLTEPNHRLGVPLELSMDSAEELTLTGPNGFRKVFRAGGAELRWTPETPGLFLLEEVSQSFAVNALAQTESDLSGAVSGTWGQWSRTPALARSFTDLSPWLLVLALALFAFHWLWLRGLQGRPA